MKAIIDHNELKKLIKKKKEGYHISPDQIARCVIGSRFDPTNGRKEAREKVRKMVLG